MRRVEGYVIVSSDGMIANAKGEMPAAIRNDADQEFFQAALDRAAVVVHGRHSYEGGPRAAQTQAPDADAPDRRSCARSGAPQFAVVESGRHPAGKGRRSARRGGSAAIAVIGGTEVFSMFLPLYDAFHLSRAADAHIPGGRPVFTRLGRMRRRRTCWRGTDLKPGPRRDLDREAGVCGGNLGALNSPTRIGSRFP